MPEKRCRPYISFPERCRRTVLTVKCVLKECNTGSRHIYCGTFFYKRRLLRVKLMPSVQKITEGFGLQSQTIRLLFVIFYPTKQIIGQ